VYIVYKPLRFSLCPRQFISYSFSQVLLYARYPQVFATSMSSATSTIRKTAHLSPKQTRKYHSKPGELLTPVKHSLLPPLVKRRVFVIRRPNTSGPSRIPALKMSDNSNEQPPPYEHATLGMPVYDGQIHPYFRLTVRVPQQFQRPPATPISTLALTTCDPTWENVPVQYIREKVALFGPEYVSIVLLTEAFTDYWLFADCSLHP